MFSKKTYRDNRWIEYALSITEESDESPPPELEYQVSSNEEWRTPKEGYHITVFDKATETWEDATMLKTMLCGINTPKGPRVTEGLQVVYDTGDFCESVALQPTDHDCLRIEHEG